MFHHPKRYFIDNRPLHVDATGKATDKELRVATTLLLWEMAIADKRIVKAEYTEIVKLLDRAFQLMDDESAELIEIAKVLSQTPEKVEYFVKAISQRFTSEQRNIICEMVERVAMADGYLHETELDFEEYLVTKLRPYLAERVKLTKAL